MCLFYALPVLRYDLSLQRTDTSTFAQPQRHTHTHTQEAVHSRPRWVWKLGGHEVGALQRQEQESSPKQETVPALMQVSAIKSKMTWFISLRLCA